MTEEAELDDSHLSIMERRSWTRRVHRLPLRFRDEPPQHLPSLSSTAQPPESVDVEQPSTHHGQIVHPSLATTIGSNSRRIFTTAQNIFGLSRQFYGTDVPLHDPEAQMNLSDIVVSNKTRPLTPQTFHPFPNRSAFMMGDWFWNSGTQKSLKSFHELMNLINDSEFKLEEVRDVNWDQVNRLLATEEEGGWVDEDAGWVRTPVTISVPYQPRRGQPSDPQGRPRNYVVDDFYHRNLVSIIKDKIAGPGGCRHFHTKPYELHWQPANSTIPIRVQGELYTSPAFVDAHQELQDLPGEPGCDLPRVIAALMFWSDSTRLTSFGKAKLWPLYLCFGNDSKYRRCKPSCHLCEHVAYFQWVSLCGLFANPVLTLQILQQLPDSFKEFATMQTAGGKAPTPALMTHCARELFHAQWRILLDDDFLEAWKHGIAILCADGLKRRVYPRIFSYAADYPKK
jgi:hypothetical protein